MIKSNSHILETERFILRKFNSEDLNDVFRGLSHPDVIKYYGVSFTTLEATKEQMTWFSELEKNGTGLWLALYSKEDNKFYGAGGLNDLDKPNKKAEIGFWLLPKYWGKGIMGEVMPQICQYGFDNLGLHRIEGFVDSKNENCKKALLKLDFNYEGTMVDCEFKNGKYNSLEIYSLIDKRK